MNIYESINQIMLEVTAIKKEKKSTQGFNYRGIDDVMNAIQPLLAKYKVFVVPTVINQLREERQTAKGGNLLYSICTIEYTFYAEDGSSVSAITIGEGMDSGDKATNKAMAIAFKYALFQVFCIPTEEMIDPDAEGFKVKSKVENKPKNNENNASAFKLSDGQVKRLWALANNSPRKPADKQANEWLHQVIAQSLQKEHIEELTRAEYDKLCDWLEAKK